MKCLEQTTKNEDWRWTIEHDFGKCLDIVANDRWLPLYLSAECLACYKLIRSPEFALSIGDNLGNPRYTANDRY